MLLPQLFSLHNILLYIIQLSFCCCMMYSKIFADESVLELESLLHRVEFSSFVLNFAWIEV